MSRGALYRDRSFTCENSARVRSNKPAQRGVQTPRFPWQRHGAAEFLRNRPSVLRGTQHNALRSILLGLALTGLVACGQDNTPAATCKTDDSCLSGDALRCEAGRCVTPRCPSGTRYVPGGRYLRGCAATVEGCEASAQPQHTVTLTSGFCLAEHEASVAEYRSCLAAGSCPHPASPETLASLRCSSDRATFTIDASGDESLPMSCLLWAEAAAYCMASGGRLPTEAEWERAARGRDDRPFPWGRTAAVSCDQGTNFAGLGCAEQPWPTSSMDRSGVMQRGPFGHLDLAGNLSEWVADFFDPSAYASCGMACTDPTGPQADPPSGVRVRRGGAFLSPLSELRSFAREFHRPQGPRSDLIGVRCAFPAAN